MLRRRYTAALLAEDPLNNSAWNYRHFVIANTTSVCALSLAVRGAWWDTEGPAVIRGAIVAVPQYTDAIVQREVAFVLDIVKVDPVNSSAWSYLRGCVAAAAAGADLGTVSFRGFPKCERRRLYLVPA